MKHSNRSFYLQIVALALAFSFGARAHAETPREELAHAQFLLEMAKSDYKGHRAKAMEEVAAACKQLGVAINLKRVPTEKERQLKSDEHLVEAQRLLREARDKLEAKDRERVAARVEVAITEIDAALKVSGTRANMEAPREELAHAHFLLELAKSDYKGHRAKAMEEVAAACKQLGVVISGKRVPTAKELQLKSDEHLAEAHKLLSDARDRLEAQDRERIAARIEVAITEIDTALKIK